MSNTFCTYINKKKQMNACLDVQRIKKEFVAKKEAFEQIQNFGEYAPDFSEKQRSVRKAKRTLDLNEKVAAFRLAETDLQTLLDSLGQSIASTLSPEIKVEAGNPFFETKGHTCKGTCHG
ncbi:hypothetical protein NRIC_24560 [Enterococcus florum]|uniref:Uncharacterized protein n=2 Tax=Enterococcus florum TaxID=2480627 RepID=A0A4P5P925_9ENTE|nr:hypothetical protein NRIC_24560 [Enterococcus florum]